MDPQVRARVEGRSLHQLPSIGELSVLQDRQPFKKVSSYIDDHIGFAMEFNQLFRLIYFYLFHDSPSGQIRIGQDGFIFLSAHKPATYAREINFSCSKMSTDLVEQSSGSLQDFFENFTGQNYRVVVGIVPSKHTLYPDKFPYSVRRASKENCRLGEITKLAAQWEHKALQANSIFHYPYQEFQNNKHLPNFYPKENFHAHGMSNHVFTFSLFSKLGFSVSDVFSQPPQLVDDVSDLSHILGFKLKIQRWQYQYSAFGITQHDQSSFFDIVKNNLSPELTDIHHFSTAEPLSNKSALVLSNSFGNRLVRHLAVGYKNLYHLNLSTVEPAGYQWLLTDFIDQFDIKDLIFIYQDTTMIRTRQINGISRNIDIAPE